MKPCNGQNVKFDWNWLSFLSCVVGLWFQRILSRNDAEIGRDTLNSDVQSNSKYEHHIIMTNHCSWQWDDQWYCILMIDYWNAKSHTMYMNLASFFFSFFFCLITVVSLQYHCCITVLHCSIIVGKKTCRFAGTFSPKSWLTHSLLI